MPVTVLRAATYKPVKYSPKCRRCGSLANRSPKSRRACWTTSGKATMPAMARTSVIDRGERPSGSVQKEPFYARDSLLCKRPVQRRIGKLESDSNLLAQEFVESLSPGPAWGVLAVGIMFLIAAAVWPEGEGRR